MDTNEACLTLLSRLFTAEDKRLNGVLLSLSERNREIKKRPDYGFFHSGEFFMPAGIKNRVSLGNLGRTSLDPSLHDEMADYLKDRNMVESDRAFMRQILFRLLKPCKLNQEIRDALPECLVDCLPELKALRRQKPAGYTVQNDERALRQYENMLPKMEFYSAARLMY